MKQLFVYAAVVLIGLSVGYLAPRLPVLLKPNYKVGDYSSHFPDAQTRVVVYGTASCSFCQNTRDYLRQQGVKFADLDVEQSSDAATRHRQLGGGGVPVVVIGRRLIRGYQPEAFAAALAEFN